MKIKTLIALILVFTVLFTACRSNEQPSYDNELSTETTTETTPQPMETTPIETEPPLELILIDNTPAEEYVDIEAGANNPANNIPWAEAGERTTWSDEYYIIAMGYKEISLAQDGISGFTWNEFLQVEPPCGTIGTEIPPELLELSRRRIQNRDAARVVANEMLEMWHNDDWRLDWVLSGIQHDSNMNIWIFRFGAPPRNPSWGTSYAVNGYNGQVIRVWVS